MPLPPQRRRSQVLSAAMLIATAVLAGCAQTNFSSEAGTAVPSAAPTAGPSSTVKVESGVAFPLWLPGPAPAGTGTIPLRPPAEQALRKGLAAAQLGDWPAAIAAFKEANRFAHASPAVMFNLALAYQNGGWPIPAAIWYRTYVAATPNAPNAPAVRAEIRRLISQTEDRVFALLAEAEGLADELSATPGAAGAKSLRQAALEGMAYAAYASGMQERGDHLAQKAAALDPSQPGNYTDKHGLWGAYFARDPRRVDDIVTRFGKEYDDRAVAYRIYTYWMTGHFAEAERLLKSHPTFKTYDRLIAQDTRTYGLIETVHDRIFISATGGFDGPWVVNALLPALETGFWDGRPDVAVRLASKAVAHYRKYHLEYYREAYPRMTPAFESDGAPRERSISGEPPSWNYLVPLAVLGDRRAIEQEMRRWRSGSTHANDFGGFSATDNVALLLAANLPAHEAAEMIPKLVRWGQQPESKGDVALDEQTWAVLAPLSYFGLSLLKGDSTQALAYLRIGTNQFDITNEFFQEKILRALRFAVATRRPNLALQLAEHLADSRQAMVALNRLRSMHSDDPAVFRAMIAFADSIGGGWRPDDADHARRVWRWLDHNPTLDDVKKYGPIPTGIEEIAKSKPERLPVELAVHAAGLWMAAMTAQVAD